MKRRQQFLVINYSVIGTDIQYFKHFLLGLINLSDSCAKCGWSWSASYHQCFTIRDHRTCSNVCISLFLCSDKTDVDFPGWAELGQWIFVLKDIYQISAWLSLTSLDQYSQLIKDSYQPQHMGTGTTCRGNILRFYFAVRLSMMKAKFQQFYKVFVFSDVSLIKSPAEWVSLCVVVASSGFLMITWTLWI